MVSRVAGGATMTVFEEPKEETKTVVMHLKPSHNVRWTEDTIDNEFLNKKKSKSKSHSVMSRHTLFQRLNLL